MKRRTWIAFWIVQVFGELASSWDYTRFPGELAGVLWSTGNLILLPGRVISLMVVEWVLWEKLTLTQLNIVGIALEIFINFAVWLGCAKLARHIKSRKLKNMAV